MWQLLVFSGWYWSLILFSCICFSLWSNLSACFCENTRRETTDFGEKNVYVQDRDWRTAGRDWQTDASLAFLAHADVRVRDLWLDGCQSKEIFDCVPECLLSGIRGVISINVLMIMFPFMNVLHPYSGVYQKCSSACILNSVLVLCGFWTEMMPVRLILQSLGTVTVDLICSILLQGGICALIHWFIF